jgi:hypothetical protein
VKGLKVKFGEEEMEIFLSNSMKKTDLEYFSLVLSGE